MRTGFGKLILVPLVLLAAVGGTAFLFAGRTYTVTAYFFSAEGLTANNDVVMGGMPVGTVQSVRLGDEDQARGGALVVLAINSKFAPLHEGTQATIEQKGVLGTMFVNLTPGPESNPSIASGGSIPIQDTSSPVDLDQVMDVFTPNVRQQIQTMTRQGGVALNGNGPEINKLLNQLPAITSNASSVTGNIDAQYQQLDELTVEFDNVAYQMASEDQALRGDLTNGAALLNTMAAHNRNLQNEITFGNLTLSQINGALNGHQMQLNQLLQEMPAFLRQDQQWSNTNSTALAILDPCVGNIINAVAEMQSAQQYQHPQNATPGQFDATGMMLRVSAVPEGPGQDHGGGQNPPMIACSGGSR